VTSLEFRLHPFDPVAGVPVNPKVHMETSCFVEPCSDGDAWASLHGGRLRGFARPRLARIALKMQRRRSRACDGGLHLRI